MTHTSQTQQITTARRLNIASNLTPQQIATRYFHAEYGTYATSELVAEIVAELTAEELDTIVATVLDQPHLIGG
jgi:hypothetical protein